MAGVRVKIGASMDQRDLNRVEMQFNKVMQKMSGKEVAFNINGKSFTQPLGRITAQANEFTKSLEASNARVIAFGASVGIINAVSDAFKGLVAETVKFEKTLMDINVIMNSSSQGLQQFGDQLFRVAKNTAQSFSVVATAALEFSRQGLTMEETLKRTNDALVLTRLTSLKAEEAVAGLTAAVNAFAKSGLTTTNIIDKLAAVDVRFAVSSEDLIHALERTGAVAIDAGVELNNLIGLVTALQQTTARGGSVIGNGLKTIFTRIQRPESIRQIEELGIGVRNLTGAVLPADKILLNMAKSFDTLTQAQQSNVVQFSAGIFQANVFRAALRDLAKESSIYQQASKIAGDAAGEAALKNEQLNKTLAALASQSSTAVKELAGVMGDLMLKPELGNFMEAFLGSVEGLKNALGGGEKEGNTFAKGFVRGIGNVLTGPGLLAFGAVFIKMLLNVGKFASQSIKDVLGIVDKKEKIKQMEEAIVNVLAQNKHIQEGLNELEGDRAAQEKFILKIIEAQTNAMVKQKQVAASLAGPLLRSGVGTDLTVNSNDFVDLDGDNKISSFGANGIIPRSTVAREKQGALNAGYQPGAVDSMEVKGMGRVVYNKAETVKQFPGMEQPAIMPPKSSRAGMQYKKTFSKQHGFNPYSELNSEKYAGFIPNYAVTLKNDVTQNQERMHLMGTPYQNLPRQVQSQMKTEGGGLAGTNIKFNVKTSSLTGKLKVIGQYLNALGVSGVDTMIPFDFIDLPVNKKGRMTNQTKDGLLKGTTKQRGNFAENLFLKSDAGKGYSGTSKDDQAVVDAVKAGEPPSEVKAGSISLQNILSKSIRRYSNQKFRNTLKDVVSYYQDPTRASLPNNKIDGFKTNGDIAKALLLGINKLEEDSIIKNLSTLARMGEYTIPGMSHEEVMSAIHGQTFRNEILKRGIGQNERDTLLRFGMSRGFIPNYASADDIYNNDKKTINARNQYDLGSEGIFHPHKNQQVKATGNVFGTLTKDGKTNKNYSIAVKKLMAKGVPIKTGFPVKNLVQGSDFQGSLGMRAYFGDRGGATTPFDWQNKTTIGDKDIGKGQYNPNTKINEHSINNALYADAALSAKSHDLSKIMLKAYNTPEVLRNLDYEYDILKEIMSVTFPESVVEFIKGQGIDGWEKVGRKANLMSKGTKPHMHDISSRGRRQLGLPQGFNVKWLEADIYRDYVNASKGLVPNFASTDLYRGTSPRYPKIMDDIPNPPQFLFDKIMAANTKSEFIEAVKHLGISHSMGGYSGSYNEGARQATLEELRGKHKLDPNEILHGGYVYPRPIKGDKQRIEPSGFVSRSTDKAVAESFAKALIPGYEYDPNEMGRVEKRSVPNKRIFDQTRLERFIDRFGLENVKRSFKEGMRKGTLKDIYLNLHKFRPKVESTNPLDMFSPNAGESERSIGMSSGSMTTDEREITHIWSKRSPFFGEHAKGLTPNFVRYDKSRGGSETWEAIPDNRVGKYGGVFTGAEVEKMRNDGWARTDKKGWHFVGGGRAGVDRVEKGEREARRKLLEAQGMMRGGGKMIINNETGEMFHGMDHQQIAEENNLYDNGGLPFHFLKTHMGTKLFDSRADGGKGGYVRKMFASLREKTINPSVLSQLKNIAEENAMVLLRDDSHSRNREGDILYDSRGVLGDKILPRGLVPNFYNLNRRNLSDGDKMSDRQRLLKMWHDKMDEIRPYAEQIKKGGARADIDPIISRKNAEANEIWGELQKLKSGKNYYIPNFNVNLENGYHGKGAIGKAIGKVYKSKTGMAMKKQDLDFVIERYIAAIDDKQADDGPNFISSYPGGHFSIGGERFNFNEISMALMKHGQFHKSFKSGGLIPNFSNPLIDAINREKDAGVPGSRIRIEQSSQLKSPQNPAGLAVTNTRDEPGGVAQGIRRAKMMKIDPKKHGAAKGFTPNFNAPTAHDANESNAYPVKVTKSSSSSTPPSPPIDVEPLNDAHKKSADLILKAAREYLAALRKMLQGMPQGEEFDAFEKSIENFSDTVDKGEENFKKTGDSSGLSGVSSASAGLEKTVVKQSENAGLSGDAQKAREKMREYNQAIEEGGRIVSTVNKQQEHSLQKLFFMQSAISMVNGTLQELSATGSETTKKFAEAGLGISNFIASIVQARELGGQIQEMTGANDGSAFSIGQLFDSDKRQSRKAAVDLAKQKELDIASKKGPQKGIMGKLGGLGNMFGKATKIFGRFVPILGQLYTGFTAINEIVKFATGGDDIMALLASESSKAAKKIEQLGKVSEATSAALEAVRANKKVEEEMLQLQAKGDKRTREENSKFIDLQLKQMDTSLKAENALAELSKESVMGAEGVELFKSHMTNASGSVSDTEQALEGLAVAAKTLTLQQSQLKNFISALEETDPGDGPFSIDRHLNIAKRGGKNFARSLESTLLFKDADGNIDAEKSLANIEALKNFNVQQADYGNMGGIGASSVDMAKFIEERLQFGSNDQGVNTLISLLEKTFQGIEDADWGTDSTEIKTFEQFIRSIGDQLGRSSRVTKPGSMRADDAKLKQILNKRVAAETKRLDLLLESTKFQNKINQVQRDIMKAGEQTAKSFQAISGAALVSAEQARLSAKSDEKFREQNQDARKKFSQALFKMVPKTLGAQNIGPGFQVKPGEDGRGVTQEQASKALMEAFKKAAEADINMMQNSLSDINSAIPEALKMVVTDEMRGRVSQLLEGFKTGENGSFQEGLNNLFDKIVKEGDPMVQLLAQNVLVQHGILSLGEEQKKSMAEAQSKFAESLRNNKVNLDIEKDKNKLALQELNIREKTLEGALIVRQRLNDAGSLHDAINKNLMGEAAHLKVVNDHLAERGKIERESNALRAKILEDLRKEAREGSASSRDALIKEQIKNVVMQASSQGKSMGMVSPELEQVQRDLLEQSLQKLGSEINSAEIAASEAKLRAGFFSIKENMERFARANLDKEKENLKFATNEAATRSVLNNNAERLSEVVGMKLDQEILQARDAFKEAEVKRKLLETGDQRQALALMQHKTEMEELKSSTLLNKEKLAISIITGDMRNAAEQQLQQQLTDLQKGAISSAMTERLLNEKTELAAKMKRANELQDLENSMKELRLSSEKAFVDQATLEANTKGSVAQSKLGLFGEMRSAGTKASLTGNADDLAAAAQAQLNYNRALTGTTSALDQVNVELANMAVSASNLKADLIAEGFAAARDGMAEVFESIALGTKSVNEALSDFGLNIAKSLTDRLMKHNVEKIISNLTFAFTGKKPKNEAEKMKNALQNAHDYHIKKLKNAHKEGAQALANAMDNKLQDVLSDAGLSINIDKLKRVIEDFPKKVQENMQEGANKFAEKMGEVLGSGPGALELAMENNTGAVDRLRESVVLLTSALNNLGPTSGGPPTTTATAPSSGATDKPLGSEGAVEGQNKTAKETIKAELSTIQTSKSQAAATQSAAEGASRRAKRRMGELDAEMSKIPNSFMNMGLGGANVRGDSSERDNIAKASGLRHSELYGNDDTFGYIGFNRAEFDTKTGRRVQKQLKEVRKFFPKTAEAQHPELDSYKVVNPFWGDDGLKIPGTKPIGEDPGHRRENEFAVKDPQELRDIAEGMRQLVSVEKASKEIAEKAKSSLQKLENREAELKAQLEKINKGENLDDASKLAVESKLSRLQMQKLGEDLAALTTSVDRNTDTKVTGKFSGGKIKKYHDGGLVKGYNNGGEVLAMLEEGEYVIPKDQVGQNRYSPAVQQLQGSKNHRNGKNRYSAEVQEIQGSQNHRNGKNRYSLVGNYNSGGHVKDRIMSGVEGIGSMAASIAIAKWMGDDADDNGKNAPTFDAKRFNTLGLDSDVNMKASDSRLSARFKNSNRATQDYRGYLKEKHDYEVSKKNEKFSKNLGLLQGILGSVAAAGVATATQIGAAGIRKGWEATRNTVQGKMGFGNKENVQKFQELRGREGFEDINYSEVAAIRRKQLAGGFKDKAGNVRLANDADYMAALRSKTHVSTSLSKSFKDLTSNPFSNGKNRGTEAAKSNFFKKLFEKPTGSKNRGVRLNAGGSVPAMLTKGEAIIPSDAASAIGYDNLNRMNTTGEFPVVKGRGGIDNVGPISLNSGDFVLRRSSTEKLMRSNPNLMRLAASNPEGFRRTASRYYDGGLVGSELTYPSSSMGSSPAYGTRQAPELSTQPENTSGGSDSSKGAVTNNINVSVKIDQSGSESSSEANDAQGAESSYAKEKDLSQKIKAAVLDVIRQEKRVGGELS